MIRSITDINYTFRITWIKMANKLSIFLLVELEKLHSEPFCKSIDPFLVLSLTLEEENEVTDE